MFWGLKIRLWKCLRGGRDRISCHGVLLDRTTTLWTENWCRCRPSTTCSQRTSKPFESMTKHLWLINVENTMTWWSCSGTVNNKIINVFDWDRQNFQMNEWYRKYNSYKNQIIESVCQVLSVLTLKVELTIAKSSQYSRYKRFKTEHLGCPIENFELRSLNWEYYLNLYQWDSSTIVYRSVHVTLPRSMMEPPSLTNKKSECEHVKCKNFTHRKRNG